MDGRNGWSEVVKTQERVERERGMNEQKRGVQHNGVEW